MSAAAVALAFFLPAAGGAQTAAPKKDSRITALEQWVAAIESHVPGELDEPVVAAAKVTPAKRALLLEAALPFATHFRDRNGVALRRLSETEAGTVSLMVQRMSVNQTFPQWLHRAVMFETDVAVLAPELTAEAMRNARGTGMAEAIHAEDGEVDTRDVLNWHWGLARDLLDTRAPAASDAFAASWYHAVALYQLDHLLLAELEPHLLKAFPMFPADARIQFDEACLADAFGSRRVQAVLISLANSQQRSFRPKVPSGEDANQRAKRRFARVIELDANFAEARVRLARLQIEDGEDTDALALLATAFRLPMSRELEYMAHLFAGRGNAALGHTEAAAAHFNSALKLFPTAQTPVIALSHVYLQSGELERAAALASSLRPERGADQRDDPWWSYFQATWMGEGTLLDQLRDQVRR